MSIHKPTRSHIFASLLLVVLPLISSVAFYQLVVGKDSTPILSVLFGWQWIYAVAASVPVLLIGLLQRKKGYAIASVIVAATLLAVLAPARFIESSRLYITGEGGPAGPHFDCLVWDNSVVALNNGSYRDSFGLCTLMSIPSYNKFIIDRSRDADSQKTSPSYYIMFVANELSLVSGIYLAYTKIRQRPSND